MAWLADWTYRKTITLSRASGAVTNYQMKLLVGESSGATGEDVDCGGLCASDFDDIRFTTSDGETLLDYWIESVSGTTPNQLATIWVEFDSIGTGATTFYMYYGNAEAAAYSNGEDTFLLFDHFDGDLSKWAGDTASASIASSICTLECASGSKVLRSSSAYAGDIALRTRANLENIDYVQLLLSENTTFSPNNSIHIGHNSASTNHSQHYSNNEGNTTTISNTDIGFGSYHIYDIMRFVSGTDTARTWTDGVQNGTGTTTYVPDGSLYALLRAINAGATVLCDWLLIRNYVETEPAWGSWAAQETVPGEWLADWTYRKTITLSRASGAVTAYQMKLLVGESSGATGEDVDCGGHCASDFDDIRFTTSDGETLLDYWIESVTGTTPNQLATIWIEFDSIGTGATTFYMYYGNAGATAASSGANTFPFFDDFNDSSLDTAKWTNLGGSTEGAGTIVITDTGNNGRGITGKTYFGTTYAFRTRVKPTHYNSTTYLEGVRFQDVDNSDQSGTYFCHVTSTYNAKHTNLIGANHAESAIAGAAAGTWCIVDIRRNGATNVTFLVDNANTATITSYVSSENFIPGIVTYANGSTIEADWALIRQYLATEPAWGSWGSEEETTIETFTELEDAALYLTTRAAPVPVRVTSAPLEIISDDPCSHNIRVTSAPLEIISDDPCSHNIRVTSAVIEIVSTEYVVSVADDARLELSAYYLELEDALLYLQAAALAPLEDSKLWLRAHDGTEFNDALMYLYTQGYEYDDALMYLTTSTYEYDDAMLYLSVTDAITYDNVQLYLYVTDGIVREDCSLYLTAIANVPAAISSVYHRLTSIISEV